MACLSCFRCCTSIAVAPLPRITDLKTTVDSRYKAFQVNAVTDATHRSALPVLKTSSHVMPSHRAHIIDAISLKIPTLPDGVKSIIADYMLDKRHEIECYQELLPSLRVGNHEAYLKLAKLIESGFSVALLTLISLKTPAFHSLLANAISWQNIPITTIRPLDRIELCAHLKELRLILEHKKNQWVQIDKDELNDMLKRVGITRIACYQLTCEHGVYLYLDRGHPDGTLKLWKDMADVAYPPGMFWKDFFMGQQRITQTLIKDPALSEADLILATK